MRSNWEATMYELVELERELRLLTSWYSPNGSWPRAVKRYKQLEIRMNSLAQAAKLLKAEESAEG